MKQKFRDTGNMRFSHAHERMTLNDWAVVFIIIIAIAVIIAVTGGCSDNSISPTNSPPVQQDTMILFTYDNLSVMTSDSGDVFVHQNVTVTGSHRDSLEISWTGETNITQSMGNMVSAIFRDDTIFLYNEFYQEQINGSHVIRISVDSSPSFKLDFNVLILHKYSHATGYLKMKSIKVRRIN